ncbi:DnaB-like helicase C-terminal domain-containing protein [Pseudodesulfovibrio pelocollis]|uniref:DnaB-like helicase C-terminal domain-containing protein n=1 Tax=Pseudodesulfovibrio pelocollis TaxID=3051432 RepID=UPI00255B36FE|nr:DnaB-like helicase C-terminal domain-containing protein [Pseudodesulfovibrio sp. SB368]
MEKLSEFGINEKLEKQVSSPPKNYHIETTIPELDHLFGNFKIGEVSIVTSPERWLLDDFYYNLIVLLTYNQRVNTLYYPMLNDNTVEMFRRLLSIKSGTHTSAIDHLSITSTYDNLKLCDDAYTLEAMPLYISESPHLLQEDLEDDIKKFKGVESDGFRLVLVDNLLFMRMISGVCGELVDPWLYAFTTLKRLAERHQVHIIFFSQDLIATNYARLSDFISVFWLYELEGECEGSIITCRRERLERNEDDVNFQYEPATGAMAVTYYTPFELEKAPEQIEYERRMRAEE